MHGKDYYQIGTLSKTHGINGELVLNLDNVDAEDIQETGPVFIEFDGLMVPFFILHTSPRNASSVILKLEDIDSSEQASEFVTCKVFSTEFITSGEDDLLSDPDSVTGYHVIDKKYGDIGIIREFLNMPQNPLFRVVKGKREILVPVNEEYILEINDKDKNITIDSPEGLIDLFS